ncbi:MAG: HipA N-terminal domain-containing protein [Klebsiella pneumoniae]|nr:HipA N-terminal domain-containing protein [Klebsiella pneumoniae]
MEKLTVALNGIIVGTLEKTVGGEMSFYYQRDWLERAGSRAISLSMPLREERYRGKIVYNFFDNLLPDSEQIRSRIKVRFHVPTKQPFDLLARIRMDCVGAIQLWPYETNIPSVQRVDAEPLTENEIEHLLQRYKDAPLGMQAEVDDFRISLAGAQEKTALQRVFRSHLVSS